MEEHGLHNALGVDPFHAYEVCLRAVRMTGGIVFPPVPFAPAGVPGYSRGQLRSGDYELYPPSLWVSRELCNKLYVELMESMADLGFKSCIAFGGHWPADLLLQEIEKNLHGRIGEMRFWGGGTIRILKDVLDKETEKDSLMGGHGMMWETSLVAAMRPDWVDLERASRIKSSLLHSQLQNADPERLEYIRKADPKLGERFINTAAERIAKIAKQMLGQ